MDRDIRKPAGSTASASSSEEIGVDMKAAREYEAEESVDETTNLLRERRNTNLSLIQRISNSTNTLKNRFLGSDTSGSYDNNGNGRSNNGDRRQSKKPIAIPVRVEPKVFFANERTFLNWLHTSVLISTIGLALLNLSPNKSAAGTGTGASNKSAIVAGLTLIPVSIIFLGYALYTYFWRDRMIRLRMPGPYNTVGGPIFITLIFIAALLINYFVWFADHGTDPSHWG